MKHMLLAVIPEGCLECTLLLRCAIESVAVTSVTGQAIGSLPPFQRKGLCHSVVLLLDVV
jgi:hypothetical protein